jgi:hypothetical protein
MQNAVNSAIHALADKMRVDHIQALIPNMCIDSIALRCYFVLHVARQLINRNSVIARDHRS